MRTTALTFCISATTDQAGYSRDQAGRIPGERGRFVISVVVPVLDGLPWLEEQLEALSVQKCARDWEVLVADNGSTDGSVELASSWAKRNPRFHSIDTSARRGPGAARNIAVGSCSGELLAFCDADDVVSAGWLEAMSRALEAADVVAGNFDTSSLNGAGPVVPRAPSVAQLEFLPAGLGSNLGVRREVFEALGGFSEDLLVGEDVDFCWRAQLAGYRFASAPDAVVAKREHERLGSVFRRAIQYGRSGPLLYKRYKSAGAQRHLAGWFRAIAWMLVYTLRLGNPSTRRQWVRTAGIRLGRIIGSVEQREFFP